MNPNCIKAVIAAAGRPLSQAKIQAIDDAIDAKMRELARQDRQRWQGLSRDERITEAATAAMQDVQAQAALKENRATLQVLRMVETNNRVQALQSDNFTRSQAYMTDLDNTENYLQGIFKASTAQLKELISAANSREGAGPVRKTGMFLFGLENPVTTRDVVREVFKLADGHTGNKVAQDGAKAWLQTIESMRLRFNSAGADVGKLEYGYLSQAHDAIRVRDAGSQKWAADTMPLLDREQYVNTDGSLMKDADLLKMLEGAHDTIATGGLNKIEPGQFKGTGARANRGSDHRALHFKDGDAWIEYMGQYGEGTLYDAMIGHIGNLSRDIALVERMGPNPEATHRMEADIAQRADAPHNKTFKEVKDSRSMLSTPDARWRIVKGETGTPENRFIARLGSNLRNLQTAAKITWGPFSALGDPATVLQTLHYHRIPAIDYLRAYADQTNPEHRAFLETQEVISESILSSMNRWSGDNMTHSFIGRMTDAVMNVTLMNAWTNAGRNAFADVMMRSYVKKLGKSWQELDEWDQHLMGQKGITEADWAIISKATPDPLSPVPLVSGPRIRATGLPGAREAATKWTGYVSDESQFAVVNPNIASRAITTGGGKQPGTPSGETWRTVMQFKAYPITMFTRHYGRIYNTPQGLEGAPMGFQGDGTKSSNAINIVKSAAALVLATTIAGAIQTQARALLSGKDPITIDPTEEHGRKFWLKAFAAGGGGTFLADVLMAPMDDPSYGFAGKLGLAGPVPGAFGGLIDVAKSNNPAASAVRWGSDQLPGVDSWQIRAAYEHWFLYSAQEALNPGYLARMKRRAQRDWGQGYWWDPAEPLPERAPDFSNVVGE